MGGGINGGRYLTTVVVTTAALTGFLLAQHHQRPMAARQSTNAENKILQNKTIPVGAAIPEGQPMVVGNTAELVVAGLRQTQTLPMNLALVTLARAWIGRPYSAFSLDRLGGERLRLDLTHFDCFLFVEQLLALANTRQQDSTRSISAFADNVRKLRYQDGNVDYCSRQHYFSQWTEAAERQGYVVNITSFLPGATTRTRRLNFMSNHAEAYVPMQLPRHQACIKARESNLQIQQIYLPLSSLGRALPSLRNGDLFGLVTRVDGLDVTHVGVVELVDGRVDALHAAPGRGVMRSMDLARYVRGVPDVIGVTILRPMPKRMTGPGAAAGDSPKGG